jgi:PAS domain S-box-containing protein
MSSSSNSQEYHSGLVRGFRVFARVTAAFSIVVGGAVFAGWLFGMETLKVILPGQVAMKANASVAFVACGVSLWCLAAESASGLRRTAGRGLALLAGLIGMLTVSEYIFGCNLGIDLLLFPEKAGAIGTFSPGRMLPLAGINFVLLSLALLLLNFETRRGLRPAQILVLPPAAAAILTCQEYLFGMQTFSGIASVTRLAVHGAVVFIALCAGILCVRPDRGVVKIAVSDTQGGSMWRRLFPMAIVVPALLGWLRLEAQRAGHFEAEIWVALFATATAAVVAGVIWWYAKSLDTTDRKRRTAEEQVQRASLYTRSLFDASLDPLVTISREGKITDVNTATEQVTGVSRDQLMGSDFFEYFTEPAKARRGCQEVFAHGTVRDYPLAIRHTSGRITDVLYSASVFKGQAGEIEGVFVATRDITERKRAEEKLREQAALLDLAHDAIIVFDLDFRIALWSRGAIDTYGFSAEEAVGRLVSELLNPVLPGTFESIKSYLAKTREWEGEIRHTRRDGKQIVVSSRWSLLRDEEGHPTAIMEINRDITERKDVEEQLRASSSYARSLIDASLDPLVTISREGQITDVNKATEQVTGVSREQLIGSDFFEYFTEPAKARQGYQQAFEQGTVRDYPLAIRDKAGRTTDVLYNATVYKNPAGEIEGVFAAARDISERKRFEEELKRSNAELQQFAYVASHDLQEPLRMVASYTQLLAQRYQGKLDSDADEFIGFAVDGAKRMQNLIEDLLAYSRVGTRKKEPRLCESEQIARSALKNLSVAVEESGASIEIADLPEIKCDALQLETVLQNLIANAIKFRNKGKPCVIQISARQEGQNWIFWVKDNGIGIEPRYFARIFQVFQRLCTREEYPGNGIGLAICKKIVERHHGRIWLESQAGAGTTFYFTIPVTAAEIQEEVTCVGIAH